MSATSISRRVTSSDRLQDVDRCGAGLGRADRPALGGGARRAGRAPAIMNTGLFAAARQQGFMAWREFAERTPDMPIGWIMQGATSTELSDEVIAGYEAPFPTPESKAGAQRFPLLVPPSEERPRRRASCSWSRTS